MVSVTVSVLSVVWLVIVSSYSQANFPSPCQVVSKVAWYTERAVVSMPLGSLVVMVLVRTIQVNISQVRVREILYYVEFCIIVLFYGMKCL